MSTPTPKLVKRLPPKLPISAFSIPPLPPKRTHPLTIIDSHVHLITQQQIEHGNILWVKKEYQGTVLGQCNELDFYDQVVTGAMEGKNKLGETKFEGFIFVQAEAKHDDSDEDGSKGGWDAAIDEVDAVCKAALAHPNAVKLLGLVPWAPIHQGPTALSLYLPRLQSLPSFQAFSHSLPNGDPIKSFRYLLQSSPAGFCLTDKFVQGLKWLGENGWAFDMTLDSGSRGRGTQVLEEAIECISKVHQDVPEDKQTRCILDHLAKPDLLSSPTYPLSPSHSTYITLLYSLSLLPHVHLKLSGLLDCLPAELVRKAFEEWKEGHSKDSVEECKKRVLTFLEPALEAFGEEKILVGSDHPMFRLPTLTASTKESPTKEDESLVYAFQLGLYRDALVQLGVEGEGLDSVFAGNAKRFYRI